MFSSTFKQLSTRLSRPFSHGAQPYIFSNTGAIVWQSPEVVSPFSHVLAVYQDIYTIEAGENKYLLCKSGEVIRKYTEIPENWILPHGLNLPKIPQKIMPLFQSN